MIKYSEGMLKLIERARQDPHLEETDTDRKHLLDNRVACNECNQLMLCLGEWPMSYKTDRFELTCQGIRYECQTCHVTITVTNKE